MLGFGDQIIGSRASGAGTLLQRAWLVLNLERLHDPLDEMLGWHCLVHLLQHSKVLPPQSTGQRNFNWLICSSKRNHEQSSWLGTDRSSACLGHRHITKTRYWRVDHIGDGLHVDYGLTRKMQWQPFNQTSDWRKRWRCSSSSRSRSIEHIRSGLAFWSISRQSRVESLTLAFYNLFSLSSVQGQESDHGDKNRNNDKRNHHKKA